MINIFSELKNKKGLANSEKTVASYMINYPEKILQFNVNQLAEECFVSVSVIYRLCDKLELDGFSELKLKISQSLSDFYEEKKDIDYDFPIKENQTHYEMLKSLKDNYEQTLLTTFQLFDINQIRKAVSKMKKARAINIYTSSSNICFAENFKIQMREIGILVEVPVDEYEQRLIASTSDENKFAIVISYGGKLVNIDFLARILKERKTPILLISSCDYTFKDVKPDFHLYMSSQEHRYIKVGSFSSRLSLLYILDALYSSYFELDYQSNLEKRINYYKMLAYDDHE